MRNYNYKFSFVENFSSILVMLFEIYRFNRGNAKSVEFVGVNHIHAQKRGGKKV